MWRKYSRAENQTGGINAAPTIYFEKIMYEIQSGDLCGALAVGLARGTLPSASYLTIPISLSIISSRWSSKLSRETRPLTFGRSGPRPLFLRLTRLGGRLLSFDIQITSPRGETFSTHRPPAFAGKSAEKIIT